MKSSKILAIIACLSFDLVAFALPVGSTISDVDSTSEIETDNAIDVGDIPFEEDFFVENSNVEDIENQTSKKVCTTSECQNASQLMLSMLDQTVEPCDDFYQYVCGKWNNETTIPSDKSYVDLFYEYQEKNNALIKSVIEGEYEVDESLSEKDQELDKQLFYKLKSFYDTCMNTDDINKKGAEPLIKLLNDLKIFNNKDDYKTPQGLATLLANIHKYQMNLADRSNVNTLFSLEMKEDSQNPKLIINEFRQPMIILKNKKNYTEKNILLLKNQLKLLLTNIYGEKTERDIDSIVNSAIDFETKLANITVSSEELKDKIKSYNPTSLKELNKKSPYIDWNLYLKTRYSEVGKSDIVDDNMKINIKTPTYFENLKTIIEETDVDTIAAYTELTLIYHLADYIADDIKTPYTDLYNKMSGMTELPPRSDTCVQYVEIYIGMITGRYYVKKVSSEENIELAKEMVAGIKSSYIEHFNSTTEYPWLDENTREYAVMKAERIFDKVGYPESIKKPEEILNYYEDLKVVPNDFFTTIINSIHFYNKMNSIDTKILFDEDRWQITPQTINAYYSRAVNGIYIPVAILLLPFFDVKLPNYLSYGSIGSIIGHEIGHAFDNKGKLYDAEGKMNIWWDSETEKVYDEKSKCFVNQYESFNYEIEGNILHQNGTLTLSENIADNIGIARSYESWEKSYKLKPEQNMILPGFEDLTPEQLFFIAYGQNYCSKMTNEYAVKVIEDSHSLAKGRVNAVAMNSDQFAKAFKCKEDSPMNIKDKCVIW